MRETFFECKVLAQKIIEFKEKNKLTYQKIGEELGLDKSYLNRVVKLDTFPSLPVLIRLAKLMQIPLYALFMPSDHLLRQEFVETAKAKMAEMKLNYDQLGEKTEISPIRLMDIFDGNSVTTQEERTALSVVLDVNENAVIQEDKMALLESLITGLDLQDTQKENVLRYIKDNLR